MAVIWEKIAFLKTGTWTPVVRGSGTAGTYELTTGLGRYTKIGGTVFVSCTIVIAPAITGGGTGYLQITGLPFTKIAGLIGSGPIRTSGVDYSAGATLAVGFITYGASATLCIYETNDNAGFSTVQIAGVSVDDLIDFSLFYDV